MGLKTCLLSTVLTLLMQQCEWVGKEEMGKIGTSAVILFFPWILEMDLLSNVWKRNHFICTFQSDSHPLFHLVLLLTLWIKRRKVSLFLYLKLEIQDSKHLFSQITWLLSHRCKNRSHQVLLTVSSSPLLLNPSDTWKTCPSTSSPWQYPNCKLDSWVDKLLGNK